MNRFTNISLVYECDRPTIELAATLAKDHRARLTLVHAVKELPAAVARVRVGRRSVDVARLVHREARARLREVAASLEAYGVRPRSRLLIGEPFVEIIRDVLERRRDLVVMTGEGKPGLRQRIFGTTSSNLIRKCPVPLLVTKPGRRPRFSRVLAAIDPEVTGDAHDTLNGRILDLASRIVERDGAEFHVAHAWRVLGESMLVGRGGLTVAEVADIGRAEIDRRRRAIASLLKRYAAANPQVHLVKGDAEHVIPRLVAAKRIDLLVMGTVCRTGIPGLIIGNTAERVLAAVDCGVLVVKPEGFVSPVAPLVSGSPAWPLRGRRGRARSRRHVPPQVLGQ